MLILIKCADYCVLTSLDTAWMLHMLCGRCGVRRILMCACVAPRCRGRSRGRQASLTTGALHTASHVYVLDVGPWP